jgi:hypothetical protein
MSVETIADSMVSMRRYVAPIASGYSTGRLRAVVCQQM